MEIGAIMAKKKVVYCVEDEESIRGLLAYVLKGQNFESQTFSESKSFWDAMKHSLPNLVLLDIMLDGEDGLTILHKMKQDSRYKNIPVIMLTAKTSEYDIVRGLDEGADDYIKKPFGVVELVSRIKAVMRRTEFDAVGVDTLSIGELSIQRGSRIVTISSKVIELTMKEYDLLLYLIENKNLVLSREQIMNHVWGFMYEGETRTVDMHIMTLRQKLDTSSKHIKTVRGIGYRWEEKHNEAKDFS